MKCYRLSAVVIDVDWFLVPLEITNYKILVNVNLFFLEKLIVISNYILNVGQFFVPLDNLEWQHSIVVRSRSLSNVKTRVFPKPISTFKGNLFKTMYLRFWAHNCSVYKRNCVMKNVGQIVLAIVLILLSTYFESEAITILSCKLSRYIWKLIWSSNNYRVRVRNNNSVLLKKHV